METDAEAHAEKMFKSRNRGAIERKAWSDAELGVNVCREMRRAAVRALNDLEKK